MKEISLVPKEQPLVGIDAEVISPDVFVGKGIEEIKGLEVLEGNRRSKLGDFFDISGSASDDPADLKITIDGDVSRSKNIGREMTAGEIHVKGDAGMYIGRSMRGGKIIVEGNADSFAGQQMRGGELTIKGDCGDYLGCAYRGDWRGMRGGTIMIEGSAGNEIGEYMMGGKILIKGDAGFFVGLHMRKGLIAVDGRAPGRVGACMMGGNIVIGGIDNLLPTFKPEGEEDDPKIDGEVHKGMYLKYTGDHSERMAKGTLYLKKG